MKRLNTIVGVIGLSLLAGLPVAAQSVANQVLRGLADDLVDAGVVINKGPERVFEGGVEWQSVRLTFPHVKGRVDIDFIRAVEDANGDVTLIYPEKILGFATPVPGLPKMALTIDGAVRHVIEKPGRAQVHRVDTDQLRLLFENNAPQASITATIRDYTLTHTEDVGVPLRANRIRDIPMSGVLDLTLKGVLGLLRELVKLGEISQTQADIGQMMAGPFFIESLEGSDHLSAKIQLRENGALLINGDPL